VLRDLPWIETGEPFPLGAIVAVARVVDIREMTPAWIEEQTPLERAVGDWQPGRYGWVLDGVVRLEKPVPLRGLQGLFNVSREDVGAEAWTLLSAFAGSVVEPTREGQ
jgi:hypothetical protein